MSRDYEHWARTAGQWIAWARAPNHDFFWAYRTSLIDFISVVHPFADRGRFVSQEPGAPFVLETSYFGRERFEGVEERDGLRMHFAGWSQPLQNYMAALRRQDWPSPRFANPFPMRIRLGLICGVGTGFLCFSG